MPIGIYPRTPLADRLADFTMPEPNTGCLLFFGYLTKDGYGLIAVPKQPGKARHMAPAHRVAYELDRGPIPSGLVLGHLCRNRACVNPDHLEPVDNRTNLLRGIGFAALKSRQSACVNGHLFDDRNTYRRPGRGGRACRECHRIKESERKQRKRSA